MHSTTGMFSAKAFYLFLDGPPQPRVLCALVVVGIGPFLSGRILLVDGSWERLHSGQLERIDV